MSYAEVIAMTRVILRLGLIKVSFRTAFGGEEAAF